MRVNISRIQARLMCPAYEHYRYRLKRAPQFAGVALYTGIAVHKFFEVFLPHASEVYSRRDAMDALEAEFKKAFALCEDGDERYEKLNFDLKLMRLLLPQWEVPKDWRVLGVEKIMEVDTPINGHTLFGRLDALVEWNGRLWHMQHKTASAYTSIPIYVKAIQRSWHENVYAAMVRKAFPDRLYGGTCLNLVRKVAQKVAQDPKAVHSAFHIEYIPISTKAMNDTLTDLDAIVDTMHFEEEDAQARRVATENAPAFRPVQHHDACTGKYGNSLCAYLDVCEGTDTILSSRFADVDPLAAYGLTEGSEE